MPQIKPGQTVMIDGCEHVFLRFHKKAHAVIVPLRKRRTKRHRADLTLQTDPPLFVPCHRAKTVPLTKLPKPHGEIDQQHVAAIKAGVKLESATQAAENAYQPIRDHAARGMMNLYHERD